jgi:hypothetical protein
MRSMILPILAGGLFWLAGCASIPPEAPELSAQLGTRISSLEAAHTRLVEEYFAGKREKVEDFLTSAWTPVFAREFFSDPAVEAMWQKVAASDDPEDRITFITLVGPKLQAKIDGKRRELMQPLDELEATVKARLRSEYDNARAMNNSITTYLRSASKVEENRRRYLAMLGIQDAEVDRFVSGTDEAVSRLLAAGSTAEARTAEAETFIARLREIRSRLGK